MQEVEQIRAQFQSSCGSSPRGVSVSAPQQLVLLILPPRAGGSGEYRERAMRAGGACDAGSMQVIGCCSRTAILTETVAIFTRCGLDGWCNDESD